MIHDHLDMHGSIIYPQLMPILLFFFIWKVFLILFFLFSVFLDFLIC